MRLVLKLSLLVLLFCGLSSCKEKLSNPDHNKSEIHAKLQTENLKDGVEISYEDFVFSEKDQALRSNFKQDKIKFFKLFEDPFVTPISQKQVDAETLRQIQDSGLKVSDINKNGILIDLATGKSLTKACYGYAMDQTSGQFLSDASNQIDKVLSQAKFKFEIIAAGEICVDSVGSIVSFNTKSQYSGSVLSLHVFFEFLLAKGLSRNPETISPAVSLGLMGFFGDSVKMGDTGRFTPADVKGMTDSVKADILAKYGAFIKKDKRRFSPGAIFTPGVRIIDHDVKEAGQIVEAMEKLSTYFRDLKPQDITLLMASLGDKEKISRRVDGVLFKDFSEINTFNQDKHKIEARLVSVEVEVDSRDKSGSRKKTNVIVSLAFQKIEIDNDLDLDRIIARHSPSSTGELKDSFFAHHVVEERGKKILYVLRPRAGESNIAYFNDIPAYRGSELPILENMRIQKTLRDVLRLSTIGLSAESGFEKIGDDAIGSGAAGEVFLYSYTHPKTKDKIKVAVKVPLGEDSQTKINHEISILEKLSGAAKTNSFYLGKARLGGKTVIVMHLGFDLETDIPRDPKVYISDAIATCEGLADLEGIGISHGDVKPGNMLRGQDGILRVVDFDTARAIDDSYSSMLSGKSRGTDIFFDIAALVSVGRKVKAMSGTDKKITDAIKAEWSRNLGSADQFANLQSVLSRQIEDYSFELINFLESQPSLQPVTGKVKTPAAYSSTARMSDDEIRKMKEEYPKTRLIDDSDCNYLILFLEHLKLKEKYNSQMESLEQSGFLQLLRESSSPQVDKRPDLSQILKRLKDIQSRTP
ncbi:MAG: protein kinase [Oligoflexales bacterium]|nr:protein kinase [Oligoflexales bacterium]